MKKECPSCAMEIEEDCTKCPICNYEFPQQNKFIQWIAIILIIIFILLMIF